MKKNVSILIGLLVTILAGCNSINYITIETYNPAEVTYPSNTKKVVIVNNAVPQPGEIGFEYKFLGRNVDTCTIRTDSVLPGACQALAASLSDQKYFNDIFLYREPIRTDDVYYQDSKLSAETVNNICNEAHADAVISIDRMLFFTKKQIIASPYDITGTININISAVIRSYLPGRNLPLATVHLEDSVYWYENASNLTMLELLLPSNENAIRVASQYLAFSSFRNFVPYWKQDERWYYTGISSRWKEATAYASKDKWEQAGNCWLRIFNTEKNKSAKAKLAVNLALYYEIKGNLTKALEYAIQAHELFSAETNAKNTEQAMRYQEILTNRIHSDKKLNMQFDKK